MHPNLKEALVLIARQPMIRTVEIADLVDMDAEMVQPMLKSYIDAGHIIVSPIIAPNGRPANAFRFTERFRKSAEYSELVAVSGDAPAPAPAAPEAAPAPTPAPAVPEAPAAAPAADPEISKTEAVIRFIRANGSASAHQLRELMKLPKGYYPMSYLKAAVQNGRLKIEGGIYYLGDGAPKPEKPAKKAKEAKQPEAAAAEPAGAPIQAAIQPVPSIRCGLWSDGVLELQRDGATVLELSTEEQQLIAKFRESLVNGTALEVRP